MVEPSTAAVSSPATPCCVHHSQQPTNRIIANCPLEERVAPGSCIAQWAVWRNGSGANGSGVAEPATA